MGSWGSGIVAKQGDENSDENSNNSTAIKDNKNILSKKFPPSETNIKSVTLEAKRQLSLMEQIVKKNNTSDKEKNDTTSEPMEKSSGTLSNKNDDKGIDYGDKKTISGKTNISKNPMLAIKVDADEHVIPTLVTVMQKFVNRDVDITIEHITEVLSGIHVLLCKNIIAKNQFLMQGGYKVFQALPNIFVEVQSDDTEKYSVNLVENFFNYLLAMILDISYSDTDGFTATRISSSPLPSPRTSSANSSNNSNNGLSITNTNSSTMLENNFTIKDVAAMKVVENILRTTSSLEVALFAVNCIYHVISADVLNTIYIDAIELNSLLIEILSCETKYINFKGKRSFNEELAFKLLQNVDTILRYNFTVGSQLNNRTLVSYIEILQMYTYNTQAEKSLLDDMSNVNNTKILTMKHMNYILSGIKGMISDCHSRNSEINLKASPLMLEYLKLQLRWVRRRLTSKRNTENNSKMPDVNNAARTMDEDEKNYLQESKEFMDILSSNVLFTLEILGLLILRDSVEEYESFNELQGWRLILDVIHAGSDFLRVSMGYGQARHNTRGVRITLSTKQQPVSESALWLFRELILVGARRCDDSSGGGGIPWLVRLLREAWPRATLDLLQPKTSLNKKPGLHSSFGAGAYDNLSDEEVDDEDDESAWAHTGTAVGTSSLRLALLQSVALLFSRGSFSSYDGTTLYHKDVTGSKVPLLNILIPTPGNLNGSQVPVGHCGNTKTLSAMRLAFCESGGVRFLLNLSLQGSNFDHNENTMNPKRKSEAQYAFHALGACLDECEHNKKFIEEEIGFVELANLLNSSSIDLSEKEFNIILSLYINNKLVTVAAYRA